MAALAVLLGAAAPVHAAELPAAFSGNWGPDAAACRDPDGTDVMSIGPAGVAFYEARTVPRTLKILRSTGTDLVLANRMRGEGQTFQVTLKLKLGADRQTMAWSGHGRDPEVATSYVRCPS